MTRSSQKSIFKVTRPSTLKHGLKRDSRHKCHLEGNSFEHVCALKRKNFEARKRLKNKLRSRLDKARISYGTLEESRHKESTKVYCKLNIHEDT
jgi:hypothetical protein